MSKPLETIEQLRLKLTTARLVEAGLDFSEPIEESICACCGEQRFDVRKRRRNTAYCESLDHLNWIVCCGQCFAEDVEHFAELWDTYYHG